MFSEWQIRGLPVSILLSFGPVLMNRLKLCRVGFRLPFILHKDIQELKLLRIVLKFLLLGK